MKEFEEKCVEDTVAWLASKGFDNKVQTAFQGVLHVVVSYIILFL